MSFSTEPTQRISAAENDAALDKCRGHLFDLVEVKNFESVRALYRCTKCGGTATFSEVVWYRRGVEHAKAAFAKSDTEVICALEKRT